MAVATSPNQEIASCPFRLLVWCVLTAPTTGSLIGLVYRARKWPLPGPTKTRSTSYGSLSLVLFTLSRKTILWSRGAGSINRTRQADHDGYNSDYVEQEGPRC
jgi:hypothetical protein